MQEKLYIIVIISYISAVLIYICFISIRIREMDSKIDSILFGVCRILYGDGDDSGFIGLIDSQIGDKNPKGGDNKA